MREIGQIFRYSGSLLHEAPLSNFAPAPSRPVRHGRPTKRRAGTVGSKAPDFLVCVIAIGIGKSARSQSAKYHAHPGFMSFLVSVLIIRPNDKTSWIVWSYQRGLLELIDIRDMHALRSPGQHLDSPKSAFVALATLAAMRRASSRLQCEWVPSPKIVATIGFEVEARRPKCRNITENLCAVMP
jgi:hypothetical protein